MTEQQREEINKRLPYGYYIDDNDIMRVDKEKARKIVGTLNKELNTKANPIISKELFNEAQNVIKNMVNMNFQELRQASGMNQSQFSRYFHIPLRTVQHWEAGTRKCPTYLLELMEYKLNNEGMIKG